MSRNQRFQRLFVSQGSLLIIVLAGCIADSAPVDPVGPDAEVRFDVQVQDAEIGYEAIVLAPDAVRSGTNDIAPNGTVVGVLYETADGSEPRDMRPFVWRPDEGLIRGATPAVAAAVNALEVIVGFADAEDEEGEFIRQAVAWDAAFADPLVVLASSPSSASAINDRGNIVATVGGPVDAAYYLRNSGDAVPIVLQLPQGFRHWGRMQINNRAYVSGAITNVDARQLEAVVWRVDDEDEVVTPSSLPHLAGARSSARGINDEGDVVGESNGQAVLWRYLGGQWSQPINLSPSNLRRTAADVSSRSENGTLRIVGEAAISRSGTGRAVVWTVDPAGLVSMQELPVPAGFHPNRSSSFASRVNHEGWIAGGAWDHGADHPVAVLWRPISDPDAPPTQPPSGELQAAFTFTCDNSGTCHFSDTSTGDPTGWSWNFGDGGTSTMQHPTHSYSAGTYPVLLEVSNPDGTDSAQQTITCRQQGRNLRCR